MSKCLHENYDDYFEVCTDCKADKIDIEIEREQEQAELEQECIKNKTHFKTLVPSGGYDYCFYCGGK